MLRSVLTLRGPRPVLPCALFLAAFVCCGESYSIGAGSSLLGHGGPGQEGGMGDDPIKSARPSVAAYLGKVKTLTTSLPATAAEVDQVERDPNALGALVDQWMATPVYRAKMRRFYGMAFQQSDNDTGTLNAFGASPTAGWFRPMTVDHVGQSFPRTVEYIVENNLPFTQTLTTQSHMMTPALLGLILFVDGIYPWLYKKVPNPVFRFGTAPVPYASSINPQSPNYLQFSWPSVSKVAWNDARCLQDPIVVSTNTTSHSGTYTAGMQAMTVLAGIGGPGLRLNIGGTYVNCGGARNWVNETVSPAQQATWRMVNFRKPKANEDTTMFYEHQKLTGASEVVVNQPRTGFMDTYAFQAFWATNRSNQHRVTMNQAMIVALGQAFDGSDQTQPKSLASLDATHSPANSACYGCHLTLDPMRQFFLQTWETTGYQQRTQAVTSVQGQWAWDGAASSGNTTAYLAAQFASSPRFATAWTQKACTYFRSSPCDPTDPEFVRIASDFKSSNYNFKKMVRALLTSPLITFSDPTQTEEQYGQAYSVYKKPLFCDNIEQRLGIVDPCGFDYRTSVPTSLRVVTSVAGVLPSDGYSRGATAPTQANDPTVLYSSGLENACKALAGVVVDGGANSRFSSGDPVQAIASMVQDFMGVSSERSATPIQIITKHYQGAVAAGFSKTDSLRSAFTLTCLAPGAAVGGMN